jgi:hypothetical protein
MLMAFRQASAVHGTSGYELLFEIGSDHRKVYRFNQPDELWQFILGTLQNIYMRNLKALMLWGCCALVVMGQCAIPSGRLHHLGRLQPVWPNAERTLLGRRKG